MGEIGLTHSPNPLTGTNGIKKSGKARNVLNVIDQEDRKMILSTSFSQVKMRGYFCSIVFSFVDRGRGSGENLLPSKSNPLLKRYPPPRHRIRKGKVCAIFFQESDITSRGRREERDAMGALIYRVGIIGDAHPVSENGRTLSMKQDGAYWKASSCTSRAGAEGGGWLHQRTSVCVWGGQSAELHPQTAGEGGVREGRGETNLAMNIRSKE